MKGRSIVNRISIGMDQNSAFERFSTTAAGIEGGRSVSVTVVNARMVALIFRRRRRKHRVLYKAQPLTDQRWMTIRVAPCRDVNIAGHPIGIGGGASWFAAAQRQNKPSSLSSYGGGGGTVGHKRIANIQRQRSHPNHISAAINCWLVLVLSSQHPITLLWKHMKCPISKIQTRIRIDYGDSD